MNDTTPFEYTPHGSASDALMGLIGCLADDYGSTRWRRLMDHVDHLSVEQAQAASDAAYTLLGLFSDPWIEGDREQAAEWRRFNLEPHCERCAETLTGAA